MFLIICIKKMMTPLLFILMTFMFYGSKVEAAGEGLTYIPKGAITVGDLFLPTNSDAVVTTISNPDENNGLPYSQISLSGSNNFTSIWSQEDYRLNFDQSFEGRAYVNFGTVQADGFAFVMQNTGLNALTTAVQNSDGQNLGVYGSTHASRGDWAAKIYPESWAIKKSVAIEFDLYTNKKNLLGTNAAYDENNQTTPHLAYAFPGNRDSYSPLDPPLLDPDKWFPIIGSPRQAALVHNGIIPLNESLNATIQNGTWYEFRYRFVSDTKEFQYYLKNPATDQATAITTIPWDKLSTELDLANNDNKAYWGFTAANGSAKGETKFVFSQTPVNLEGELTNGVTNSQDDSITVEKENTTMEKSATVDETLTVHSDLKITGESPVEIRSWQTKLLSEGLQLNEPSDISEVLLTTGEGKVFDGEATLNPATGEVLVQFPTKAEIGYNQTARLSYKIKTKSSLEKNYFVEMTSSVIGVEKGKEVELSFPSDPTYFWIEKPNVPTKLSWEKDQILTELTVEKDPSELISSEGTTSMMQEFWWQDDDNGDSLIFSLRKAGNETVLDSKKLISTGLADFQSDQIQIPLEQLVYGDNNFVISIEREKKNQVTGEVELIKESEELKLLINVSGKIVFEKAPDLLKWTDRTIDKSKGILPRDADNSIDLKVFDSREGNPNWTITAKMVGESQSFNLIWKNSANEVGTDLAKAIQVMDNHSVAIKDFSYVKSWDTSSGVLLESENYLPIGDYSNQVKVTWRLNNTASPD
ncbi:hypothetical protein [Enterococcus sp. AZ103]|uniref:hypothetical protein n=1 Tax=Enterococcus sp. AZ103 TaxID=2774628 RepID=UPI003F1FF7CD